MPQNVIITSSIFEDLAIALSECSHDKIFVLTDSTTHQLCWPVLSRFAGLRHAIHITIPAGDTHKSLDTLAEVWNALSKGGATRHSCIINLGGGMVTDLGGFVAATFKRGINYVNIPTTLLSMVDASVGGKTGINFCGLKNEIGAFSSPQAVIISTRFLQSLDQRNMLSGYAEMLKHGLISDTKTWAELINFDITRPDLDQIQTMVAKSVAVKERIVEEDPHEKNIRKALNLGHTIGHALESWSFEKGSPVLHGEAVAAGLVSELYLSHVLTGFPIDRLRTTSYFIKEHYGRMPITCDDYPQLLTLMGHDKKNMAGIINFTLLGDIGDIRINQTAGQDLIEEALDFYREA